MKIVYSNECLEYEKPGHPESPRRVEKAYEFLKKSDYSFSNPIKSVESKLSLVHSEELIRKVRENEFTDSVSLNYDRIFRYALLSVGGAIKAQKLSQKGETAFSLMRPPGHHAGKEFLGGFCYFNSLAISVKNSGLKTLIIDFDGHHGNGTQDIFSNNEKVTYLSLHRSPLYPGTGGESKRNALNYPLQAKCGEDEYLSTLKGGLESVQSMKDYEQVALSAGFDTYKGDLASLGLKEASFRKIGEIIGELDLKTFAVLEGGYTDKLGGLIHEFLKGTN